MSDCAPLTHKQTYHVKTRGGGGGCARLRNGSV